MVRLLIATMALIAVQAVLIVVLVRYIKRWGSYSTSHRQAKEDIAAMVVDAQRHQASAQREYHLLQASTQELIGELYKARQQCLRPPRLSPPTGTSPPDARSA